MKRKYIFDYDMGEATCEFEVDTDLFTKEMAKEFLDFFVWDYEEDNDPIDEAMKKYAFAAFYIGIEGDYNINGVISEFEEKEGFYKVDGSNGIKLLDFENFEFRESLLDVKIINE